LSVTSTFKIINEIVNLGVIMSELKPDLIAKVRLYTTEEGGFKNSLTPHKVRLNLFFEGEHVDCSILLDQLGIPMNLGEITEVPIKLLSPWIIKDRLHPGNRFKLWRGKYVAEGEIVQIVAE
jgi:hypothetical protein